MLPRLEFGEHSVAAYPCFVVLSMLIGSLMLRVESSRTGYRGRDALGVALAGCALGPVGARAWSVVFEILPLRPEVGLGEALLHGGLSVFGGVLAGGMGALCFALARGLGVSGFVDVADLAAPGVAVAMGIGRLGCLLAGCCYGSPTLFPIALVFTNYNAAARPLGVPLHATQLYELCGCILIAAGLLRWTTFERGQRIVALAVSYGGLRFGLEFLRADDRGEIAGWPVTQVAALCLVVIAGAAMLRTRLRAPTRGVHRTSTDE